MSRRALPRLAILGARRQLQTSAVTKSRTVWKAATVGIATVGGAVWIYQDVRVADTWQSVRAPFLLHAEEAKLDNPSSSKPAGYRGEESHPAHRRQIANATAIVDPETDMPFAPFLHLTTSTSPLALIGLGVRKVSFLRVKVYSAGFYLDEAQCKALDQVSGWQDFTAQSLLSQTKDSISGEALMDNLLSKPVACAVQIVPVRNTDFGHLRDGFTRALAARQRLARVAGKLDEADEARITNSIQTLKSFFPAQSVPKGKSLVLLRTAAGSLVVEYEGKVLGQLDDPWVSKEMMLAYFADKDVISPKLKEDVAAGLEGFIKR